MTNFPGPSESIHARPLRHEQKITEAMERTYNKIARTVKRLPYGERAVAVARRRLPAWVKRLLRRSRHRMLMRSPTSILARALTPGVQNRLLGDPAVVQRLLETERAAEILNHRPSSQQHNVDWIAQVALNDPVGVVGVLETLATTNPYVDAAVSRLAAGRPAELAEEQLVDIFLSLDEFERHKYWSNPRLHAAFLDYLCRDYDPGDVVGVLETLATTNPYVDAAVSRLAAGRLAELAEEQLVDVFLSLDEFERHKYWSNPRLQTAFLDYLCRDYNVAETRVLLTDRIDLLEASARVRVVTGEGNAPRLIPDGTVQLEESIDPPVAADILLGLDTNELSNLWAIESFRLTFIDNLLGDEDLYRLRMLLQSDRFAQPEVRQSLFDALASAQPYQVMTNDGEIIVIPSADLGFSKAYWADRRGQLAHLDRFLAARHKAGRNWGNCFVDIGANVATHTIRALRSDSFSSAVLVEPDPRLLPILKANLALNQLDQRVSIAECAAGERQDEVSLWCSEVNWGDNRLNGSFGEGWYEVRVPVRPVNEILSAAGVAPTDVGALWIDVQGNESRVLAGASEAIDAGCDIVVEFWPIVLAKAGRLDETIEALVSISKHWMNLETGELVDRQRLEEMQKAGIARGVHYDADLAVIHGITDQLTD